MTDKPWKIAKKDGELRMVDGITSAFEDLGFEILHDNLSHAEATEKFLELKKKREKRRSIRSKPKKRKKKKTDDNDLESDGD